MPLILMITEAAVMRVIDWLVPLCSLNLLSNYSIVFIQCIYDLDNLRTLSTWA